MEIHVVGDAAFLIALWGVTLVGLFLIPFGLPGLWLIILAVVGYGALTGFERVGLVLIGAAVVVGVLAELLEWWLGMRYAQRYGGSARAGWGAILGAIVGGVVGLPIAFVGSVVGAFLGAFLGAAIFQWTVARQFHDSMRAGWGAALGKAFATAAKVGVGLAVALAATWVALR